MPTLKDKKAQIERLLKIGQDRFGSKFGWKAKFARALGMTPQQLNDYLSGRISIGTEMQTRLRGFGADIEWLMTGKDSQLKKELAQFVKDHPGSVIPENLPEKTRKQIKLLIEEVSKLDEGDVEKAREIIRTIFKTKKGR